MKKLLFLMIALSPMMVLADGYLDKEEPMPPIWIKKQPSTSSQPIRKTMESSQPINLVKALDANYQGSVLENKVPEFKNTSVPNEQVSAFSPYISAKLGYGRHKANSSVLFATTPYDHQKSNYSENTMVASLAFGVRLNDFRVELEGKADTGSKDNKAFGHDTITDKIKTYAVMANAYYDIPLKSKFHPYVGAGIGAGHIKGDIYDISASTTNFAWQLMVGIGYDLTEHWKLDLGYNYISYGDLSRGRTPDVDVQLNDIEGHNITLGTRYEF